MRARHLALFVLLLPASLSAQRIHIRLPWIGPRPPAKEPLPPQAPAIARELRYKASRFSAESYVALDFLETDRVARNNVGMSSMIGLGSRLDWRFNQTLSVTGDLTVPLYYGAIGQTTFDFGGRYRPLRGYEYRLRPYFDLRASLAWTGPNFEQITDPGGGVIGAPAVGSVRATGHGVGALAGTGFETALTPNWALTTGVTFARYHMSAWNGQPGLNPNQSYGATSARVILGIKYNRGRMVPIP